MRGQPLRWRVHTPAAHLWVLAAALEVEQLWSYGAVGSAHTSSRATAGTMPTAEAQGHGAVAREAGGEGGVTDGLAVGWRREPRLRDERSLLAEVVAGGRRSKARRREGRPCRGHRPPPTTRHHRSASNRCPAAFMRHSYGVTLGHQPYFSV